MTELQDWQQEVTRVCAARLPTLHDEFLMTVYHDEDGSEHVCLSLGEVAGEPLLVRVHSECLTGDVFGSLRCDCRDQLALALEAIAKLGRGMLVYLRQEGRGIGLTNKIHAYRLQDAGLDTVDANLHLGLPVDGRSYSVAAAILRDQGVQQVRLLTNNPQKIEDLNRGGVEVVERLRHVMVPRPENQHYLDTKAARLGHLLGVSSAPLPSRSPGTIPSDADDVRLSPGST